MTNSTYYVVTSKWSTAARATDRSPLLHVQESDRVSIECRPSFPAETCCCVLLDTDRIVQLRAVVPLVPEMNG